MGKHSDVFKPLPFPTYAPDMNRQRMERVLAALTTLILCCTLIPGIAGPNASLEVPVQSATLHFSERIPATVEIGWDTTNAQITPASLGYFDVEGRLVYSASVARGLVYGQSEGTAWVLEISAPLDGEVFLDPYLDAIREQVVESNTLKNLLLMERQIDLSDGSNPELDNAWRDIAPDFVGEENPFWVEKVLIRYPGIYQEIAVRLRDEAKHIGRLKELYYGSQQTRLSLLVAEHDLQLAMTRYPTNEIEGLAGLCDVSVAQAAMMTELMRLKSAWSSRRDDLAKQLASDRNQLDIISKPEPIWARQTRFGASTWHAVSGLIQSQSPEIQQPSPHEQLETSLIQARMIVTSTELSHLEDGIGIVTELEQHVDQGVIPFEDMPQYEMPSEDFTDLDIEAVKGLQAWENTLVGAPGRLTSLELLASSFFGEKAALSDSGDSKWEQAEFSPHPNEVALALWAIDLWTKQGGVSSQSTGSELERADNIPVDELLDHVVAFPEEYTPESHHLAFLKFTSWYSSLAKSGDTDFESGDRFSR